jgi:hypothetical protein
MDLSTGRAAAKHGQDDLHSKEKLSRARVS